MGVGLEDPGLGPAPPLLPKPPTSEKVTPPLLLRGSNAFWLAASAEKYQQQRFSRHDGYTHFTPPWGKMSIQT